MENNKKSPQVAGTTSEDGYLLCIKNRKCLEEAMSIIDEKQLELQELTILARTFHVRKIQNNKLYHSQARKDFFMTWFIALVALCIAIALLLVIARSL